jgi:hypothetical protein
MLQYEHLDSVHTCALTTCMLPSMQVVLPADTGHFTCWYRRPLCLVECNAKRTYLCRLHTHLPEGQLCREACSCCCSCCVSCRTWLPKMLCRPVALLQALQVQVSDAFQLRAKWNMQAHFPDLEG